MCGISGIISNRVLELNEKERLESATQRLEKRGPDAVGIKSFAKAALGHRRLSIIDTTDSANQPFQDPSGRYQMVFNGEIYNYKNLREELKSKGHSFKTSSDTEVLLHAFLQFGTSFLNKLDGFFALAIYDQEEETALIARDRFGIKPLLYCKDKDRLIFASEMKALMEFNISKELDHSSIFTYLQLNYIPEPHSIFKEVKKLEPGQYLKVDADNRIQKIPYYQIPYPPEDGNYSDLDYESAQNKFIELLDQSVEQRLVSDVPLGTFLSGGIDSSLITALAAKKVDRLNTFSIGFKDEPHFDETHYANLVAKKYKTNHHLFKLGQNDLLESLHHTLDYIDEPFADSSALAVNALSRETAKHVKVSLSGDGADEVFSGYHKHMGEFMVRQSGLKQQLVRKMKPVWDFFPQSRNSKVGNLFRKLKKFSEGSEMDAAERYWLWASLMKEADAANLMVKKAKAEVYHNRKNQLLNSLHKSQDFNDVLLTDVRLVLLSDMLRKVDLMSMGNSLEVRTPFLDHRLVNFAFSLSSSYKINSKMKKRLVQDAARKYLPEELYNRPKQGFEVPLLKWFNTDLHELIHKDLLSDEFIKEQNLFNPNYVNQLKTKLASSSPGDVQANIWALVVFNQWWKRYIA
ncbi:MAG: asparagine synthase (glutamine-hydrolyzing) [Vicingaceae bacterium]